MDRTVLIGSALGGLVFLTACAGSGPPVFDRECQEDCMQLRDINAVLNDHAPDLMALPGVVGVYVGLVADDDERICLRVMVVEASAELRALIPPTLEGYPVLIEVTGMIWPLSD